MQVRRLLPVFLSLLLVAAISPAMAEAPEIKVIVDGRVLEMDVAPVNINGRVMVPARFVAEALGAKVSWDPDSNAVVITSKEALELASRESTLLADEGWISVRDLADAYGVSATSDGDSLTISARGLAATFPVSTQMTETSGTTNTGVTIHGRIDNGRLLLLRADLVKAGFISE